MTPKHYNGLMKLGATVPDSTIALLERQAGRLSRLVEVATRSSEERAIRVGGAQLIERLGEWMEEIRDLKDIGDADVHDMIKSFTLRLRIAHRKVKEWNIPPAVRKVAIQGSSTGTPRKTRARRGRRRQPTAA